jgi:hypothetical protein
MTNRPLASPRPCAVVGCEHESTDPEHVVNAAPAEGLPHPVALCADHWLHIEQGGEWFAEEKPGDPATRGIRILTGVELPKRGLVVAGDTGITWCRGGFSPQLDPGRNFGILSIEGRIHGSEERARLDLALTPAAVEQLRFALRLYPEAGPGR